MRDEDWEQLNAYADGELDRATERKVAARLASEPALQAAYQQILTIKTSLGKLRPVAVVPEPRRTRYPRWHWAAAAALVLVAGTVLGSFALQQSSSDRDSVAELHQAFAGKSYVIDTSVRVDVSAGSSIGSLNAPDLTASNLTLVDVEILDLGSSERIAMHYRGRRGCRVTLVADPLSAAVPEALVEPGLRYAWQTSAVSFYLVADGMDPARFAAIAAFAEAASRQADEEEDLRVALVDRTAQAHPCA